MERRAFLRTAVSAVRWGVGAGLVIPGLAFLLAPLGRNRKREHTLRVARLDEVPKDNPLCLTVTADRRDAYTHYPPGPIGRVWLVGRETADGQGGIQCFQATCPHLGCMIEYSSGRGAFYCPCHASAFDRNGQRLFGPAPRDMDELPVKITEPDEDGHRWVQVQYQEFQSGVAKQRPIV